MPNAIPQSARPLVEKTLTKEMFLSEVSGDMIVLLRHPRPSERDEIQGRLISLGLTSVSQNLQRSTIIMSIYDVLTKIVDGVADETEAEAAANFLESYWQRWDMHTEQHNIWAEAEEQRLLDIQFGAPEMAGAPEPASPFTAREKARALILLDDVLTQSERFRSLTGRQVQYAETRRYLMARIGIAGWRIDGDTFTASGDVLNMETVRGLRDSLTDAGWMYLVSEISMLWFLDGSEEKNSVSPVEKPPAPIGSLQPADDPASSTGTLMESPIEPIPTVESETTTATSSGTTSEQPGSMDTIIQTDTAG